MLYISMNQKILTITSLLIATVVRAANQQTLNLKPKTDQDVIRLLLYTRRNPYRYQELNLSKHKESLFKSYFNFNMSTKIIIHGWISNNETMNAIDTLKDAFVNYTNDNIIKVDWKKHASGLYKTAYGHTNTVTGHLIEFLEVLTESGVLLDKIHLIGHSIGAHIAGKTGKHFREKHNKFVNAIIALDPAYPLFKFQSENDVLSKHDARHVEVIHSNAGFWGYRTPLGHVDFYPNGGKIQPGCRHDQREICAHDRALYYYVYSIIGTQFIAVKFTEEDRIYYSKTKTLKMGGLHLNYGKTGKYWLRTGRYPPFVYNPDDFKDEETLKMHNFYGLHNEL